MNMSTPKFQDRDLVRDRVTGAVVMVTNPDAQNPQHGNPARGFYWKNHAKGPGDSDCTGFCPHTSAGCYELVPPTRRERIAAVLRENFPTVARLFRKPHPGLRTVVCGDYGEPEEIEAEVRSGKIDFSKPGSGGAVMADLQAAYGRETFSKGWRAQNWRPYAAEPSHFLTPDEIEAERKREAEESGYDDEWSQAHRDGYAARVREECPTREQILAATVAGHAIGARGEANESYFDGAVLARYALLTAREIISQSEQSDSTKPEDNKT